MNHTEPPRKKIRVLVVDDDEVLLETTQALLESDFIVRGASSGRTALHELERESVDVVCSDYSMPGMTGFELLQEVAVRWPSTMGVLITGFRE